MFLSYIRSQIYLWLGNRGLCRTAELYLYRIDAELLPNMKEHVSHCVCGYKLNWTWSLAANFLLIDPLLAQCPISTASIASPVRTLPLRAMSLIITLQTVCPHNVSMSSFLTNRCPKLQMNSQQDQGRRLTPSLLWFRCSHWSVVRCR